MPHDALIERFAAAVEAGDAAAVRAMLDEDPSLAGAAGADGWPMFLLQSVFPKAEILDLLIEKGADPNARTPEGETLLHLTGDAEIIRKLVQLGADINARDNRGWTPMMGHAPHEETGPEAIRALLSEGADPSIKGCGGETAASLLPEGPRFAALRRLLLGSK